MKIETQRRLILENGRILNVDDIRRLLAGLSNVECLLEFAKGDARLPSSVNVIEDCHSIIHDIFKDLTNLTTP